MNYSVGDFILRKLEPFDLNELYIFKNDPEIASMLGGFTTGYSMDDLNEWLAFHRQRKDEVIWAIAQKATNRCVGHVGLYNIDFRVRMAEFAILIGEKEMWGKGVGRWCTKFTLEFGFYELNLNRIYLTVLATNERAIRLYREIGFKEEGRMRQAQFKKGTYIDILMMAILRDEYLANL